MFYTRRRALIAKTRTIILFTNTTLNRLGFGETATVHSFSLSKQSSQNNTLNVTFFLRNPARDQVTKFGHGVT